MKVFAPLKEYVFKDRWYLASGFAALILVDLLQLIIPLVIKDAVDGLTGTTAGEASLLRQALLIVAIGMMIVILRFCWRCCIIGSSRRIEASLRDRLFSHVIHLPFADLIRTRTGDLMARMTNDIDAVRMCTGIGLVAMIDTVVLGAASIIFMACISPLLTLLCLVPMLVIILATWRLGGLLHQRFARVQTAFSQMTEKVRESLAGIAVIRAFVREEKNFSSFRSMSAEYISKNLALVKVWGTLFPFIIFIANLCVCVLIVVGGRLTITGSVSPGDFVAFANYIWLLIWPMMALGWIVNLFQRGTASMARINAVLAMPAEPQPCSVPVKRSGSGMIEIRNLSFAYDRIPVLHGISLAIPAGSTIGITGTTGAGKSTLCSLLLRFFDPPRGSIFLDGLDICDMPLQELRSSIAYVPQDSFLFSDTIMANIRFGRPDASPEEAMTQAAAAQLTQDISSLLRNPDTLIGEKGITLSGGQRQRLCIARGLLLRAPVLLLDDALSSLDAATTQALIQSLRVQPKQTRIIISSRIASLQHADVIYVFDNGRIAASGTHAELLSQRGLYYRLYMQQKLASDI